MLLPKHDCQPGSIVFDCPSSEALRYGGTFQRVMVRLRHTGGVSDSSFWEQLYQSRRIPWDLGGPTPFFRAWLNVHPGNGEKVCVLGAGNGYDAIQFALAGYQTTAIDFAATPIESLNRRAREAQVNITALELDLFELPKKHSQEFDLVVEYTAFCAIDPSRRSEYSAVVASILKPGGTFLALFFPLGTGIDSRPPFQISESEIEPLFSQYFKIVHSERPAESISVRKLREILYIMKRKEAD